MTTIPPSPWHPLVDGELAERISPVIGEIADALQEEAARGPQPDAESESLHRSFWQPAIGGGLSGIALFLAYLHEVRPGQGYDDLAADLLDRAIDAVGETPSPPWLYGGFPGVAWVGEHLQGRLFEEDPEEDAGEEIAEALAKLLEHSPWKRDYDLISGLVGVGIYALERMPRSGGEECLRRVLDRLAETAEERPEGLTWWTNPDLLPEETRKEFPEGNYNLGLAHGVPGCVALLGEMCAVGVEVDRARPLLEGAVRWLLANRNPEGSPACFGYNYVPGRTAESHSSRLAWCYGDLGVALSLLVAAQGAGRADWEKEALAIARGCAARTEETAGVMDAGLCHGAFGDAHLFNRLYQASGDPAFAQAARFWYERGLDLRRPGEGYAGFPSWGPDRERNMKWIADPGFLTGASGIGLALLGATTPIEPNWDRLLLVSARAKR
jgi:lantibiotic modifying enzyme